MRIKSAVIAPVIALVAFAAPVHAEDDQNRNGQPGVVNPEGRGEGHDRGGFKHEINESHENFEAIQFIVIGGALVIALLLAYSAGKRNRKKNSGE
jgi:hypothetical protein